MTAPGRLRAAVFDAHGYRFTISSPDEELIATFDELLVDLRISNAAQGGDVEEIDIVEFETDDDGKRWYQIIGSRTLRFDRLWEGSMISHTLIYVNRRAAGECERRGEVPIHGGAAALGGRTVVLPGFSESGKTTLSAALGTRSEWTYVADEVCRLSPDDLAVAPYGKPIALRPRSVELLADAIARLRRPGSRFEQDERFVPPSELGAPTAPLPPPESPVAALVFPRVDVDEPTSIERVSPARALELLTQNTLGTATPDREPSPAERRWRIAAFGALDRLVRHAPAYELTMSDLDEACRLVEGTIG